jgi:hypothetical protein
MLILRIHCTRVETNYSNCTVLEELNIYVAAAEALRKKERQDETQFTIKSMVF